MCLQWRMCLMCLHYNYISRILRSFKIHFQLVSKMSYYCPLDWKLFLFFLLFLKGLGELEERSNSQNQNVNESERVESFW